ncbi:secretion/conjugation apparatus DotM-related subunit [Facilibium subflavum]|uniref:secretion/conjugation apparatus DotM-related subunit n=1 Tax=Facilibium subflavum TaxID=2219058 RepID=UPI000E6588B9|nr:hypothetical protein [Facilibium subflavum]
MANNAPDRDDNGMGPFYVVSIILLSLLLIYWLFHDQIVTGVFLIRRLELMIVMLWDHQYVMLMNWCNHVLQQTVTLKDLKYLSYDVADAMLPMYWGMGCVLIILLFYFHPSRKYRRKFTMRTLAICAGQQFKKLFNLPIQQDQVKSHFNMAMTPMQYLEKIQVIKNAKVDQTRLYAHLATQLGKPWSDVSQMRLEIYGLFVTFALYIRNKRKLADKLLQYLNGYYSEPSCFRKYIYHYRLRKFIDQYTGECIADEKIESLIKQHYYTYTLLCRLLQLARQGGIVASSSFLWLKEVDRTLWYALNNVGRKTYFTEAAVVNAHCQAETALKSSIKTPMVHHVMHALKHEHMIYQEAESE